jgi:hypothetical protein
MSLSNNLPGILPYPIYRFPPSLNKISPPAPPNLPSDICSYYPNYCYLLDEPNYYDKNCFSQNDPYGGLGCNAGGLICCRFCEFSQYSSVPCIQSPSLPPYPPPLPSLPPSPSPPPSPPPPNNPLVIKIDDKVIRPDKAKVKIHMRIRSTVESFNKPKFISDFRHIFKRSISPDNIKIRIRPGSLILDISVTTNLTIVENTTSFVESLSPDILSKELNISVSEVSDPEIILYEPEVEDHVYIIAISFLLVTAVIYYIIKYIYKIYNKKKEKKTELFKSDTRLSGLEEFKQQYTDREWVDI